MRRLAVVLIVSCVSLLAPIPAVATSPGANGEILYMRFDGRYESLRFRSIKPDGTGGAAMDLPARTLAAAWSPDGATIAAAVDGRSGPRLILVDRASGNTTRVLGPDDLVEVYVIDDVAWNPLGDRLVFCGWQQTVGPQTRLYTVGTDGSALTMISGNRALCEPDWSSTDRIVAGVQGDRTKLVTLAPDGSDLQVLVTLPRDRDPDSEEPESPSWAPDGTRIVFMSASGRRRTDVWLVDADGTDARRLTDTRARWEWLPVFAPDGTSVVYTRAPRNIWDAGDLWIASLGGGRYRVTSTRNDDEFAYSWRAV